MEFLWLYIFPLILVLGAQLLVSIVYNKYKTVENKQNLTGFDVARRMLDENNLNDIHIVETKGNMTDHYDPKRKVIRLSTNVYRDNSIASLAIAAHECGHAIQDKEKYTFMRIRGFLVPFINFTSKIGYVVLIIGLIASILDLALVGLILLTFTLLFQLVTLPVEFNASRRANAFLQQRNVIQNEEINKVKAMLNAAAFTYVASLLANFLEILRLFLILNRSRD